jgi:TolB-like protein
MGSHLPDIFLSYGHDDVAAAKRFAAGFEREGFTVWWDESLRAGDSFDAAIESALEDAKAVVVLWSKSSVQSRWVRAEATLAERSKTFVPVMIEDCKRPIMFELTHTADLAHWKGEQGDKAWQTLLTDVRRLVGRGTAGVGSSPSIARPAREPKGNGRLVILGAVAALVLGAVGYWALHRGPDAAAVKPVATASAATENPSLAVLPFENMSSDPEQEYFSDGLSEELINQLAHVPQLRVIGRASSFSFKGKEQDPRHIGELLGVNHILAGSVRKSGNRVKITAQLVNPIDGSNLWSETYERTLSDVFAIQDEIARTVAKALQLKLGAQDLDPGGTKNIAAFDEFLAGRALLNSNDSASLQAAAPHLERAVELDAAYIPARLWLIDAYTRVLLGDLDQRGDALHKQDVLIDQVQKLVPNSPEASLALSYRAARQGNLLLLDRLLQDALRVSGESGVRARLRYGQFLAGVGQPKAAITQLERVRHDDPLDVFARTNLVLAYEVAGDPDRGEAEMQQLLKLPGAASAGLLGTAITRAQGRRDTEGLKRALAAMAPYDSSAMFPSAELLSWLEDPGLARRTLRKRADSSGLAGNIYSVSGILQWAAYFGDKELTLKALNALVEQHTSFEAAGFILWRPVLREFRGDPGYKTLLKKWGLVDYWRATGNWGEFCKPVGKDDFECH